MENENWLQLRDETGNCADTRKPGSLLMSRMLPVALLPTANCRWISLDIDTLGHNFLENSYMAGHSKNMVKKF